MIPTFYDPEMFIVRTISPMPAQYASNAWRKGPVDSDTIYGDRRSHRRIDGKIRVYEISPGASRAWRIDIQRRTSFGTPFFWPTPERYATAKSAMRAADKWLPMAGRT